MSDAHENIHLDGFIGKGYVAKEWRGWYGYRFSPCSSRWNH